MQEESTIAVEVFQTIGSVYGMDQRNFRWHEPVLHASYQSRDSMESLGSFFQPDPGRCGYLGIASGILGHKMSQPLLWRHFKALVRYRGHIGVTSDDMHLPFMSHTNPKPP